MPPRPDDATLTGAPLNPAEASMGQNPNGSNKRPRDEDDDLEDDEDDEGGKKERRKIEIAFIKDKSRRHITFSKRKAGIMKKAYELSVLTGTQVLLLVVSETGLVYTFTTPKLQPLVTKPEGKNLIQSCLNAPEPSGSNDEDSPDLTSSPRPPPKNRNSSAHSTSSRGGGGARLNSSSSSASLPPAPQVLPPPSVTSAAGYAYRPEQAAAYQQYLQNQNTGSGGYRS